MTRNSATSAQVIAALFWPVVTRKAVLLSLFSCSFSGLLWYHLGGWHVSQFYLNTHPVWVGMIANIFTLSAVTAFDLLFSTGILGMVLFLAVVGFFVSLITFVKERKP